MSEVTRRSVVRGMAWTTPAVVIACGAPAFATSHEDPITGIIDASKCPGKSTDDPDTVIVSFRTTSPLPNSFTKSGITSLTVNGVAVEVDRIVIEGNVLHVVTKPRNNSADASGSLVIQYTVDGVLYTGTFAYSGSHPNQQLCKRI